jgi:hypothetical protein
MQTSVGDTSQMHLLSLQFVFVFTVFNDNSQAQQADSNGSVADFSSGGDRFASQPGLRLSQVISSSFSFVTSQMRDGTL